MTAIETTAVEAMLASYGDLTATAFVARSEGVWNASMVPAVEGLDRAGRDESPGWPAPKPADAATPAETTSVS